MARPKVATVCKAIEATPTEIRATVWKVSTVQALGRKKKVSYRRHFFGYYDTDREVIVLGRMMNKEKGQADELVATLIHEALHRIRPGWSEDVVQMMEKKYLKSRAVRETALLKLVNITLFGRDLEAEAHAEKGGQEEWTRTSTSTR